MEPAERAGLLWLVEGLGWACLGGCRLGWAEQSLRHRAGQTCESCLRQVETRLHRLCSGGLLVG